MSNHFTKFHIDLISSFWVILLTDQQTARHTDAGENIASLTEAADLADELIEVFDAINSVGGAVNDRRYKRRRRNDTVVWVLSPATHVAAAAAADAATVNFRLLRFLRRHRFTCCSIFELYNVCGDDNGENPLLIRAYSNDYDYSKYTYWTTLCKRLHKFRCAIRFKQNNFTQQVWLGGRVVRTLDLRSIGRKFESWPLRYRVQP